MPRWTGVALALGRRNYRLFVAGQLVSLIGTWMQSVAQAWLVYRLTGSAVWLGVIAACQQLPVVALASVGGSLADRHRRSSILLATQSAAMLLALALGALVLAGAANVVYIALVAAGAGAVAAIDIPTRQSFAVELVGKDALPSAIAINSAMTTCASSLGPVLAGFGVDAFGAGWCFVANGASFLAVIAGLAAMRDLPAPVAVPPREPWAARIGAGFRFARGDARVRALLGLLAITAFAGLPYGTLMPVLAADVFHGDARALGELTAACGVGAVIGAVLLAAWRGATDAGGGVERRIAAACGALGALLVALALSHAMWLSVALLVPIGATTLVQISATSTRIQLVTPDALRGRVMAIWAMILMGCAPLGALAATLLAGATSPALPLALGGATCVLAAVRFSRRRPDAQDAPDAPDASPETAAR